MASHPSDAVPLTAWPPAITRSAPQAIRKLRRMMTDLQPVEAMETLQGALRKYKTNEELLAKLS